MATWELDVAVVLRGMDTAGTDEWARLYALSVASTVILDHVTAGWPVDTGLSLAGFRRVQRGSTWIVYNDVDYVSFVHEGLIFRLEAEAIDLARQPAREAMVEAMTRRGAGVRAPFELRRNSLAGRAATAPSPGAIAASRVSREAGAVLERVAATVQVSGSLTQREALAAAARLIRQQRYTDAIRALRAAGLQVAADEIRRVVYRAQQAA